ncbi:hypothetical protein QR680_006852 [Steinernema hermaphroditum]|uniref:Uncharacterized protein n=1 Tax=Steinernema hermaphroditum TaxID=289476 RepID=A0AA39LXS2_9BILA|nr:hypothetical protein QR680_006852 [Steinernema hermaphroditum]
MGQEQSKMIEIEDFDSFDVEADAVWEYVTLFSPFPSLRNDPNKLRTSTDSLLKCLKRILEGRPCIRFWTNMKREDERHFSILSMIPRTFQSIRFDYVNEEAEKFILESAKAQKIVKLDLVGPRVCVEVEHMILSMILNPGTARLFVHIDSFEGIGFDLLEPVIKRWIADPMSFTWDEYILKLPVTFEKTALRKYLKELSSTGTEIETPFGLKHPNGDFIASAAYAKGKICLRILRSNNQLYSYFANGLLNNSA